jgi:MoaA/NifB/PqqE/SkfB family radical SAM enzyme
MINTTAIRLVNKNRFVISWDTGRRCNYDCTYCEDTRHNNHSPYKTLDEFKQTFDFVTQWVNIYNDNRLNKLETNISFTGGEPTVNPNFWKFIEYVKKQKSDYILSLTTNGAWGPKNSAKIIKNFAAVTISYHAEADARLKKQVIDNILTLAKTDIWLQVNVMLHVDHWNECVEVYETLTSQGIKCSPRPIGDGAVLRKGWFIDGEGNNRRTAHEYSVEQQEWFWSKTGVDKKATTSAHGSQLGRACCGGRCLEGKVNSEWQSIKLINTEFKDWYCSVDWYFLHIDQETGLVYHHQTCQALHNNQRGALGNLSDSRKMLDELKIRMQNIQPIVCPNARCGCGMCAPKAKDKNEYEVIFNAIR